MTAPAYLLWFDIETTGSDPMADLILEVGAVVTDSDLNEVAKYDALVRNQNAAMALSNSLPVIQEMHRVSGLWDLAVNSEVGDSLPIIEGDLLSVAREHVPQDFSLVLAGSGVGHFDLQFVRAQMPELAKLLAYYVIDVGVPRRSFEMWGRTDMLLETSQELKPHRALADAELHLNEARHIRAALQEESI